MRIRGYKLSVTAQIGIVIVVVNLLVALFAPLIAPFDQATPALVVAYVITSLPFIDVHAALAGYADLAIATEQIAELAKALNRAAARMESFRPSIYSAKK